MKTSPTERPNPRTRGLDRKSTLKILRALNREDASVAAAVRKELPAIARAVAKIVTAFANGGRLIYVGAGTSGRLAVLDAAECPPTFGTPPELIQAVIAGGAPALKKAVEGAEDSAQNGARDLARLKLSSRDVIVGITAGGSTPYVLGALQHARRRKATTIGITSNRNSPLARVCQITIAPNTGPEAITGSTRLKAGTAQKMVLNLLSTAAMVRSGRVYDNWMIHVALTNQKLRSRAAGILQQATGVRASTAKHALRQAGHNLPVAFVALKKSISAAEAKQALTESNGNVRATLETVKSRRKRTVK